MKKNNLMDLSIDFTLLSFFITYYCFNSKEILENSVYFYFLILSSFFLIIKSFKIKIKRDRLGHLIWYGIFMSYGCLSLLWSTNKDYSLVVLKRVMQVMIMIFILTLYIDSEKKIIKIMKLNIIGQVCMIIYLFAKENNRMYFYGDVIGFDRNAIGLSVSMGTVQLYYMFLKNKNKKILFFFPIFIYVIFKTGTRKAIVFIVIFIILQLLLSQGKNVKRILKNAFIILGIIVVCIITLNTNVIMKKRLSNLFLSFTQEVTVDDSIVERKYYRLLAYNLFLEKPILGHGIFGFAAYLNKIGYWHVAYCHNNWLEILSTMGLIGFCIYYVQYFRIIVNSMCKIKNKTYIFPFIFIILLFLMEYGLVSYFDISIQLMLMLSYEILLFSEKKDKDI